MKHIKFLYAIIVCLLCFTCEDELDIDPAQSISTEQALATEANIINILIGTYAETGEQGTFGGRSQVYSDLLGNTDQVFLNASFPWMREVFLKNILVDNFFIQINWANSYEVINQANLVLDHLDIITSSNELRSTIEGEARFLRALSYFDLVTLYSLQYESGVNNSQPGVPLTLSGIIDYGVGLSIARSSVQVIYDQIIVDLTDASTLLPEANNIFADKYAAQALLARVYLQQGNYSAAREAANDVLLNSGHGLASTFEQAFNNDSDGTEDVFAFQVTDQDGTEPTLGLSGPNALNEFYASQANGGRGGDISIQDGYLNLFDDPDNDVRASFVYINPENELVLTSKYINKFANVSIFRIAEMHLIRAEANFRLGTSVGMDPLVEINTLRARSNASQLGLLTIDLILNERLIELGFEGHFINDLRRTHSNVGSLPYNDNSLVFPIPQTEMDTNTLIEQNPGYGG